MVGEVFCGENGVKLSGSHRKRVGHPAMSGASYEPAQGGISELVKMIIKIENKLQPYSLIYCRLSI